MAKWNHLYNCPICDGPKTKGYGVCAKCHRERCAWMHKNCSKGPEKRESRETTGRPRPFSFTGEYARTFKEVTGQTYFRITDAEWDNAIRITEA